MVASLLIIVISAVLLTYWFRYTCLLILRTATAKDYATALAAANGLQFRGVQSRLLQGASAEEMSALQKSLERDYLLLTYLLRHTADVELGGSSIEQRILMLDFKLMRVICLLGRRVSAPWTSAALAEMSGILNHLANAMGERIQSASRA